MGEVIELRLLANSPSLPNLWPNITTTITTSIISITITTNIPISITGYTTTITTTITIISTSINTLALPTIVVISMTTTITIILITTYVPLPTTSLVVRGAVHLTLSKSPEERYSNPRSLVGRSSMGLALGRKFGQAAMAFSHLTKSLLPFDSCSPLSVEHVSARDVSSR